MALPLGFEAVFRQGSLQPMTMPRGIDKEFLLSEAAVKMAPKTHVVPLIATGLK